MCLNQPGLFVWLAFVDPFLVGSNVNLASGVVVDTALEPVSVYGNGATDAGVVVSEIESQIFQLFQAS